MKNHNFQIILFFVLIFPPKIFFCQIENIDSLKSFIESTEPSVEQLDALLEISQRLMNSNNGENLIYLQKAEKLLKRFPDSVKTARLYKHYAHYFSFKSEYQKATEYFLNSIRIAENTGDLELRNSALNGLAVLNIRIKNYKKGIEIFQRLLDYSKEIGDKNDVVHYSLNIAMANGEAGNIDEAEKYFLDVYNSEPENEFYKAVAANGLSFIYNNTKKYRKAYKYGKYAADFSKSIPDAAFKIESMTNYSNALKGLGETKLAEKIMFEIAELARKNNFVRKLNNAIGNLALNYEAMGDYKSAYLYYKRFAEQRDSLLNESLEKQINELQIKYEAEKKDKEIIEKNASINAKNIVIAYTVGAGAAFFLLFIGVVVLYRKKNAAYKELVKKYLESIKQEENSKKIKEKKYGSSSLKDAKKHELLEKINSAIFEEKMFLQADLTLGKLAQQLGSNSKYLSQVIHEVFGLSFSDFINQLRVKEAAKLLNDESYKHFSFEGISELVGFKTRSSFNVSFKKFTGVTPSFFSRASGEIQE